MINRENLHPSSFRLHSLLKYLTIEKSSCCDTFFFLLFY